MCRRKIILSCQRQGILVRGRRIVVLSWRTRRRVVLRRRRSTIAFGWWKCNSTASFDGSHRRLLQTRHCSCKLWSCGRAFHDLLLPSFGDFDLRCHIHALGHEFTYRVCVRSSCGTPPRTDSTYTDKAPQVVRLTPLLSFPAQSLTYHQRYRGYRKRLTS